MEAKRNEECPACKSLKYKDAPLGYLGEYVHCIDCGLVRKLLDAD